MGWKLVPTKATAENGMKAALMGEFHVPFPVFDESGNECIHKVNVPWTVIKEIYAAAVAAAPSPTLGCEPCPTCGKAPMIMEFYDYPFVVTCSGHNVSVGQTEDEAIDNWNSRDFHPGKPSPQRGQS